MNKKSKKTELPMVRLHLWIPTALKDMLAEMHQEFMDQVKVKITFQSFVQHMLEESIRLKDEVEK